MSVIGKCGLVKFSRFLCESLLKQMPVTSHIYYSSTKNRNSWTVLSNDGQTICCWHPKENVPYEHTRPLPVIDPEFNEDDSVLKVQYRRHAKHRFQPDGPTIPELAKLTYTTKHRWYPNKEKKYEDPQQFDRDGL
ncbi:hypothetical protein JTE90_007211 [Oedothorax gibbosus]|uniref:Large ribosomal subunit protein mL42 n=1 Tax=Oedothorax gibbosus TaxID=931172 RepID=A0AAV6VLA5_9ARAC|nr:hypothetical protein JTE90_007211 [Oedothorax gibbosus]